MLGGNHLSYVLWLGVATAIATSPNLSAQNNGRESAGTQTNSSEKKPTPKKTVVGPLRNAPNQRSSSSKTQTGESKTGVLHQFKAFTDDLFGVEEKPKTEKGPDALEARNRMNNDGSGRRILQRNQAASERGMPMAARMDPPSFEQNKPLPPIVSGAQEAAKNVATTIDEEFTSQQPSTNASTKSSTRRNSESKIGSAANGLGLGSAAGSEVTRDLPSSEPAKLNAYEPSNGSLSASNGSESEFTVKRKPVPVQTPNLTSTPDRRDNQSSVSERSSKGMDNSVPKNLPSSTRNTSAPSYVSSPAIPTSNPSALIHTAMPHIEVVLDGPESLQINQTIMYRVTAANHDTIQLNGLIVRLGIPKSIEVTPAETADSQVSVEIEEDGSKSILWQLETLAAGQSQTLNFGVLATKPEHFAVELEWTAVPQTGSTKLAVDQPQLQLAIEGPSEVIYGEPKIYRLRMKNPGNADVKDVSVSLQSDPESGNSTKVGDLAAGSERVIEVELTFQQPGSITIEAHATSESSNLKSRSAIEILVKQALLEAQWRAPSQHYQGSIESYELVVANASEMRADNLVCKVQLPKGCYAVSVPEGLRVKGSEVTWEIEKIHPGASLQYVFQLEMNENGALPIRFQCEGKAGASASAETTAKVDSIADLKLAVVDPVAPAPIGKPVTYELVITNRGSKPATGVKILAQFSNGIEPLQATGPKFQIVPGQIIFEAIDSIGPGQERTIRITAQASEAGSHRFRAEVTSDDNDTQLVHEESTRYLATGRIEAQNGKVRR